MIKFFRQIRKSLLVENKTSKYFKYAIGEIILVVIGILIALQINNWNEDRKRNSVELSLLSDIVQNLDACVSELESVVRYNENTYKRNRLILHHLDNKIPYTKKLDTAFVTLANWSSPYLTFTAYETLKSKGIDIIKNDSVKRGIIDIYESEFAYVVKDYDQSEWILAESVVYPMEVKYIRKIDDYTAIPNDYIELQSNDQFKNMLSKILDNRKSGILKMLEVIQKTKDLSAAIGKEIKERS